MRQGAYDYICKPFDNEELKLLVQKALEKRTLRQENQQLWASLSEHSLSMVGRSAAMETIRSLVRKVAASRSTVLIVGESGTGKELVARAVHLASPRAGRPFLPVNCAALAEGVLESELFGHVKGAFTGAASDRAGLLVSAGEGDRLPGRDRRDAAGDPGEAPPRPSGEERSSRWAAPPRSPSRPGCSRRPTSGSTRR
jgi:two-component system response regulator PilR (NtrC family)